MGYYYLVAQLPYLLYGQQPPMSSEAFKELCSRWLSKADAAILDQVSLDPLPRLLTEEEGDVSYAEKAPSSGCRFIDKWREWERTLRLDLAKRRSVKLGWEQSAAEISLLDDIVTAAQKALETAESPLEAETILDKARWHAIEELQGMDYFSRNTIFAYMLKLLILERHTSFQVETGFSEYKSLYASIMEKGTSVGDIK